MDFPLYHLDWMNNRVLIGIIAVLHVMINHPLAVGGLALIATLERKGIVTGRKEWDDLAYKFLFFCFIVTTTVGALTGVGIWLSAALVNPMAIGSLIRVFFWGWFTEWIIFVLEVTFIMAYFLTWKSMEGEKKLFHNKIGITLAIWSWLTMAIIVAILGFMMDPGNWLTDRSVISGVFNPLYFPQLLFRTPFAMISAALMCLFLAYFFVKKEDEFRFEAVSFLSTWILAWLPMMAIGGLWYWFRVPTAMIGNLPTAVTTQEFASWHYGFLAMIGASAAAVFLITYWAKLDAKLLPRWSYLVPIVLMLGLLGYFERVREFIRKPYVIGQYLYANGLRVEDYPLFKRDGILKWSIYTKHREITPENKIEAGEDVFMIACSRCHTTESINGITPKMNKLFGPDWKKDVAMGYLRNMHVARTYMPPFPGNEAELEAMTEYLIDLRDHPRPLRGAQIAGVSIPEQTRTKPDYGHTSKASR